jgi:hypothetical protein
MIGVSITTVIMLMMEPDANWAKMPTPIEQ